LALSIGTMSLPSTAEAKHCIKYGVAGAVAGHVAHHHGVAGFVAGCAAGLYKSHLEKKARREHMRKINEDRAKPDQPPAGHMDQGQPAAPKS
jgi:hypothetical protein